MCLAEIRPKEFAQFFGKEMRLSKVEYAPRRRGVSFGTFRTFLRLDDGKSYLQLDDMFQRVHDALPPYTLPFARDHAGDFFCIVGKGDRHGRIVWWDHEREVGDNRVEDVADSFEHFLSAITEFSDDD